ncbi:MULTISPECIES: 1-phosphofructokinase [Caproicibacterium]|jgi:1-phosphofructokinase|uniref:Tagatose-6-phosphate kinase n=1 Tax=Caproicibacterium lactatifermentans TaxID=2666138 RepID=A0A859DMX0_9FIRM|nr:1-phosphofructokinase [Caproicibacterium lactatifermentans]ARP49484.1 1-phosphofructokinase [Ruminococcaceae bacterium CPB6]MDD4806884.1 1-phosphofructokinase [Oscillospiraceae bacterium]QKN23076.1 1-phosphofructokinase [Caproicibacterium lactatifermentans]QKO30318.1 1-phosphofructokinase [Caproicibacterium lactatifermentans]
MLYTVTVNPALDKTVEIPNFSVGEVNRIQTMRADVGGKGINVSKCIAVLGGDTTALALLGGSVGKGMLAFLQQQPHIEPLSIETAGQTRTNLKIIDSVRGVNTDINEPGPAVSGREFADLQNLLLERLQPGDIVVLAGSLPTEAPVSLYRDWAVRCKQEGAQVFLDADGEPLKLGVEAKPDLIKPNKEELEALVGTHLLGEKDILRAARMLMKHGVGRVVVSLGSDGALFCSSESTLRASALQVPVKSTVGAGDSMVAALAYGSMQRMSWEEQAKLSVAFSAASVMCDGTQAPELKTVKKLYKKVVITEVA